MKKTILFLSAVIALGSTATAQDTIYTRQPLDNVFYNQWPVFEEHGVRGGEGPAQGKSWSLYFHTDDTLTVYGIAASLVSQDRMYDSYFTAQMAQAYGVIDLAGNQAYEYLRLYEINPSTNNLEQLGEDLYVKPNEQAPQYVIDIQMTDGFAGVQAPPLPVYERYFSQPQHVVDSFYVGRTLRTGQNYYDSTGFKWQEDIWAIITLGVREDPEKQFFVYQRSRLLENDDTWHFENGQITYFYFFPIIVPGSDSTQTDSTQADTTGVGIGDQTPADRNTVVSPNPATNSVRVASGFGISAIEAFDAAGAKVHEQQVSGNMTATLDVSQWPRGTYILRIHTALGPATKKLVVQ